MPPIEQQPPPHGLYFGPSRQEPGAVKIKRVCRLGGSQQRNQEPVDQIGRERVAEPVPQQQLRRFGAQRARLKAGDQGGEATEGLAELGFAHSSLG